VWTVEWCTQSDHSHNKWNTEARNVECGMWYVVHKLITATTNRTPKLGVWNVVHQLSITLAQ